MMTQTIFAPSMRQGLAVVREQLGEDAVILGSRRVPGGIELNVGESDAGDVTAVEGFPNKQGHRNDRISPQYESAQLANPDSAWQTLQIQGFSAPAIEKMLEAGLPANVSTLLQQALPVQHMPNPLQRGVFAFVGSAGAGKTSLISKLAVNHVLYQGNEQMAIVNTDSAKVGAEQPLRRLAQMLQIPFASATHPSDLKRIVDGFRDRALVLIDSPGCTAQQVGQSRELMSLNGIASINVLVLNGTLQPRLISNQLKAFASIGIEGLAISHLDELDRPGDALSPIILQSKPILWWSNGPHVPDDLDVDGAETLARCASSAANANASLNPAAVARMGVDGILA